MSLHDYEMHCERCGQPLTLAESSNGGLCVVCLNKAALEDEEKRPPLRGNVLLEAHDIINGHRLDQYGNPENCFGTIAGLWSLWIGKDLSAHDVAVMMALMKIARMKHGAGTSDNAVDCCGYIALAEDMTEKHRA